MVEVPISTEAGRCGVRDRCAARGRDPGLRRARSPRSSTTRSARASASSASWLGSRCATRDRRPARPGSVILKIPSQFPENRAVADHFDFYRREGRFYQQLADKVPVRTAACFWNHMDPDAGSFGLLLEDLGERLMISQIAGIPAVRAAAALRALARIHGTWWGSPGPRQPRLDAAARRPDQPGGRPAVPRRLADVPRACARSSPTRCTTSAIAPRTSSSGSSTTGMAEAPLAVCHGDFRGDNLMFDDRAPADDEVAVLDWQIAYRGPAVTDVAYFLCQSLTVEERRAHERDLVRGWYDELVVDRPPRGGPGARRLPLRAGVGPVPTGRPRHDRVPGDRAWARWTRPTSAAASSCEAMANRAFTACLDLGSADFLE